MKKSISLVLAIVLVATLLVTTLTGCNRFDPTFTGPEIHLSLPGRPMSFDPLHAFRCVSGAAVVSLIFEGLMVYDENGQLQRGVKESYRITRENLDIGEFTIEITLREAYWNIGTRVSADDFAFAWRRIIDPANGSEAAPLLFQINNAQKVNSGYGIYGIFDLGVAALDTDILEVTFEVEPGGERPDLDLFWEATASPALVPLSRTQVEQSSQWYSVGLYITANGPFAIGDFAMVGQGNAGDNDANVLVLRRNDLYRRNPERHAIDRYVTPSRLVLNFGTRMSIDEQHLGGHTYTIDTLNAKLFELGIHTVNSSVPFSQRNANGVEIFDTLNTHTYIFNTDNPLFADARVRRALSIAIDRQALIQAAEIHAIPAAGFVPNGNIFNISRRDGTSFRDASGQLIDATGNVEEARNLLRAAGVTSGSFELTVRRWDVTGNAIANEVARVWGTLGFTVTIRQLTSRRFADEEVEELGEDMFMTAYDQRDFDVIALDLEALSTNPLFILAQYVPLYSGVRGSDDNVRGQVHSSGFDSAEIGEMIESAFRSRNAEERAEILHRVEAMLIEEMPAMPLVVRQNVRQYTSDMTGIALNWNGSSNVVRLGDRSWSPD